jgi:hypothetical protein
LGHSSAPPENVSHGDRAGDATATAVFFFDELDAARFYVLIESSPARFLELANFVDGEISKPEAFFQCECGLLFSGGSVRHFLSPLPERPGERVRTIANVARWYEL